MKIALIAAAVAAGGLLARKVFRTLRIRRFHRVIAGLYRGGQPNPAALWILAKVFGVKTVVNLREDYIENQDLFGMSEFRILIPPRTNIPTMDQVREFLSIMDTEDNWPILVHCKVGANRTGIMIATYRIARQGWRYDRALDEMKRISGKTVPDHACQCLKQISDRFGVSR